MFLDRMGRSWLDHPFLVSRFRIASEGQIRKLVESGIRDVYIDTAKGDDVADGSGGPDPGNASPAGATAAGTPPPADVRDEAGSATGSQDGTPFRREIRAACAVQQEARSVVRDVMRDVRLGRSVDGHGVNRVVDSMVDSIFRNRDALCSLTRIKDYDEYTFVHSINVCVLCLTMGRHLGMSRRELQDLGVGALLHDVGKMRLPAAILNKPGKLTAEEFGLVKNHPAFGVELLEKTHEISDTSRNVVARHHERYDGSGYPSGLGGHAIGRAGQIAAIADVYDAITSDRCYSRGLPPFEGVRKIYEWGKKTFDPSYVERFIKCLGIYPVGTVVELESGEIGIVTETNGENLLRPRVLLVYRKAQVPYRSPVEVDLADPAALGDALRRSIVRPLDPKALSVEVDRWLSAMPA